MANLPNNFFSDDEWKKVLDNLRNIPTNWATFADFAAKPYYPEFEIDVDGVTPIGYKVLAHYPYISKGWLMSPNLVLHAIWDDGRLTADDCPSDYNPRAGIHGVKKLDDLGTWEREYREMSKGYPIRLIVVRIRLWGVIVETELGFRAEHAEIIEIIQELK